MRIAVTGKQGQVARSLATIGPETDADIVLVGRPELDLGDQATVLAALARAHPDIIISAAAYTAVDKAETERDLAFAINGAGAGAVASAALHLGVPIIHMSTDYVFDGTKIDRYLETDPTNPQSAYGVSKLEGERRVALATPDHAIMRTAWVYSPYGVNFLKTMLRLGETRQTLSVVGDQIGCPTSADDIARALIAVARTMVTDSDPRYRGIFHLTGAGEASWADFAAAILTAATGHGRNPVTIERITSDQYPSPVKRPSNSRLSGKKLTDIYGVTLPDWRQSTTRVVQALLG